jgi:hypothetical protein
MPMTHRCRIEHTIRWIDCNVVGSFDSADVPDLDDPSPWRATASLGGSVFSVEEAEEDSSAGWLLPANIASLKQGAAPNHGQHSPLSASLCGGSYNFPIAMGEERGDGGSRDPRDLGPAACHHPLTKALADPARAFAFGRPPGTVRDHLREPCG